MPEYLAPGVYVEEIDTGIKPIEGVSTSTAGMLGVTERGPVNVPILVTGLGEYTRWFGERLNNRDFSNGPNDPHCYLPTAVEGFFTNGGKRVYITRVLDVGGATRATFDLHNRGSNISAWTLLLRPARELTGVTASPIYVLNVNAAVPNTGTLGSGDRIRIGGGSEAEYRVVAAAPGAATHVPLNFPLGRGHGATTTVHDINRVVAAAPNAFPLFEAAAVGATSIVVTVAAAGDIAQNDLLEIGTQLGGEHRFVAGVTPVDATHLRVGLDSPLAIAYAIGAPVTKLNPTPGGVNEVNNNTLAIAAGAGDGVAFLTPPRNDFVQRDQLIIFERANTAAREARRIGGLHLLRLSVGATGAYAAATVVHGVTLADDGATTAKGLTAAVIAGATVIALDNRVGLAVGDVLRIGVAPNQEYATIAALPNPSPGGAAPNAGNAVLTHPLNGARVTGTEVRRQTPPTVRVDRPATFVVLDMGDGDTLLPVADGGAPAPPPPSTRYASGDFIRVTTEAGDVSYHMLANDAVVLDARPVSLTVPLSQAHPAGSPVAERARLLTIQALDAGAWGNRLRVSVEDEPAGLVTRTTLTQFGPSTRVRLASAAGVEAGTILEFVDGAGNSVGDPVKVEAINRATNDITLAGAGLAGPQQVVGLGVRSREFSLTVRLLRQPDPAMPTRNDTILDAEVFRYLSMDPRHSRYVQTVIGDFTGPLRLSDRRPEGESWYVRVHDLAQDLPPGPPAAPPFRIPTLESIRPGPEALRDFLPDGRQRAARHPLAGGDDSIGTLTDTTYIGVDDPNPENRTGLHSLRNIEEISIIACPGRTSVQMQNALISHCELMRYRFAALDAQQPPRDTLADVQHQRQAFDTKYAALYHPWLLVPDPYPSNLARVGEYPIPPSGHMLGIYARTDIERGVHKAPANEVVRGVVGLQRLLTKEQQDILNPYPTNINVIRDFRPNNRGIRVYGGRVITSDSDWKYVNVRRLLIFIEASIDRGLQWVVFEPNAEPLWARVRRSISNFLTLVWRNGGLEGIKTEEAYFVKCDRTTMTQADIDSGRLIVVVGVAPVKPAEFVIIRIGLWTARADN